MERLFTPNNLVAFEKGALLGEHCCSPDTLCVHTGLHRRIYIKEFNCGYPVLPGKSFYTGSLRCISYQHDSPRFIDLYRGMEEAKLNDSNPTLNILIPFLLKHKYLLSTVEAPHILAALDKPESLWRLEDLVYVTGGVHTGKTSLVAEKVARDDVGISADPVYTKNLQAVVSAKALMRM
jgi:hypothetical protein